MWTWLAAACLWLVPGIEAVLDIRVSKGHYTRGYDAVRLSVVTNLDEVVEPAMKYSSPFLTRWIDKQLHSEVVRVKPDTRFRRNISAAVQVSVSLPRQGAPVRGLLFSDPCLTSGCFGFAYGTRELFSSVLNVLMPRPDFHFWGMLGDNFYDRHGLISSDFFSAVSTEAKSKPLLTVPGNHDFWINGDDLRAEFDDQFGWGFLQFYAQDTAAGAVERKGHAPFNFVLSKRKHQPIELGNQLRARQNYFKMKGKPFNRRKEARRILHRHRWNLFEDPRPKPSLPEVGNFVFGTQLGDLAFFGYSGAHTWTETLPHAEAFCRWVGKTPSINTVVILGHWNDQNLACQQSMHVLQVYNKLSELSGCKGKPMLYFEGHKHCNAVAKSIITQAGVQNIGFIIGGAGFVDDSCSEIGFVVIDSTSGPNGPDVKVDYFSMVHGVKVRKNETTKETEYLYQNNTHQVLSCFQNEGYEPCRDRFSISFRAINVNETKWPPVPPQFLPLQKAQHPEDYNRGPASYVVPAVNSRIPWLVEACDNQTCFMQNSMKSCREQIAFEQTYRYYWYRQQACTMAHDSVISTCPQCGQCMQKHVCVYGLAQWDEVLPPHASSRAFGVTATNLLLGVSGVSVLSLLMLVARRRIGGSLLFGSRQNSIRTPSVQTYERSSYYSLEKL